MTAPVAVTHETRPAPRFIEVLDERDREVAIRAGYGKRMGFGERPALLVVDVTYGFCGREPLPILRSVSTQRRACGEEAWEAVGQMRRLLDAARSCGLPIIYSTMADPGSRDYESGLWGLKNWRADEDVEVVDPGRGENQIVAELDPMPEERVYAKHKPSLFSGTGLLPHLIAQSVDSVVICGGTTSGCVYATAIDAFSANLKVAVIEDACFDRLRLPHEVLLLDIDLKYGDVMSTDEWVGHIVAEGIDLSTALARLNDAP